MKVWVSGEEEQLHLIQEVHEHTKAVTSLAVVHSSDKLYSGSLDRTVKVCTTTVKGSCFNFFELQFAMTMIVILLIFNY